GRSGEAVGGGGFEGAGRVGLDDEAGAAGLVFHADGKDKHYGFYPSNGQLRLTCFDGPDVYAWQILQQQPSPHYRPGDWNSLKVRVEKEGFRCYVNDHLVFESTDHGLTSGKVGLAKFRDTKAEFKSFQVAERVAAANLSPEVRKRVDQATKGLKPTEVPGNHVIEALVPDAPSSVAALHDRAKQLEQHAAQMRKLASAVHQRRVQDELAKLLRAKEEAIDLVHAALLIARLDNDELEVELYRKEIERMAKEIAASLK